MSIHGIVMIGHLSGGPEIWVQVSDHLMPKHVPVNPVSIAATFRQPHLGSVKIPGFSNVPDWNGNVEWCNHLSS